MLVGAAWESLAIFRHLAHNYFVSTSGSCCIRRVSAAIAAVSDQVVFPSPSSGKLALGENDGDQDFQLNNNPHPSS